jgi:hypothetical protein
MCYRAGKLTVTQTALLKLLALVRQLPGSLAYLKKIQTGRPNALPPSYPNELKQLCKHCHAPYV